MDDKLLLENENYKKIEKVIRYIDDNFKEQPSIDTISEYIGMSKFHLIRVFKEYVGVTPIQFLQSVTLNYAKEHLKESKSILDSSLDLGLSSSSRLHDLFVNIIGVTPKEYKESGQNVEITYGYGFTPFGQALIAFTKRGVSYLGFVDSNKDAIFSRFKELWAKAILIEDDKKAQDYLDNIFIEKKKFDLYVKGTNFQINIWKALLNIPNGTITTYQDIANSINKPKAVRAVASAIGSNHIGYLVPCHRVLAKSGAMSGYRWGIEKKILIAYEALKNKPRKIMTIKIIEGSTSIKIAQGLEYFPKELYNLENTLEVLDLTDNNLSSLPDDFHRFKRLKRLFLSNNQFNHVPKILAKLPNLSMIGIRNNQIKTFEENSLPLSTRWLILTDNELTTLPNSIGDLALLQKCMLSGNKLSTLPNTINKCTNLELLRIAANKLISFPTCFLTLPKLSWLAYSGNPFCKKHPDSNIKLKTVSWNDLQIKELLGEGASGNIFKAVFEKEVAVKVFKGEMTSDGLPQEEMDINISMGVHENLIDVLANVSNHPQNKDVLMLELIPTTYTNLGLPPSLESCSRDVYPEGFSLSTKSSLKILKGMVNAAVHMHERGIMHGDFYAHNIMYDKNANSILGDFGGASYYEPKDVEIRNALERLEIRAFGCLIEELLNVSKQDYQNNYIRDSLYKLQISCLNKVPNKDPYLSKYQNNYIKLYKKC